MKKTIYTSGIYLLLMVLQSLAGDTVINLSLTQARGIGVEKNNDVRNAELESRKILYQLKEAQSKLYPQLEGYSTFNYYYSIPKTLLPGEIIGQTGMIPVELGTSYDWSSGFKASQVLFNRGLFTSIQIANRMNTVGKLTLEQKKEETVYKVSQVYYLCQATNNQLIQYRVSMRNTDQLLEIAKLQNQNGLIRKVDYSRIQVNKNNLQTQIDNLEQLYQAQIGMLKYLIGLNEKDSVALSDSFDTIIDPDNGGPSINNRTEYRLLNEQLSVAKLNFDLNRRTYLPTLALFGQHYYEAERNEMDFFKSRDNFFKTGVVGLNFSLPIFDGFEKRSKIRQAEIEIEQLQNNIKNTSAYFSKEYADAKRQYDNGLEAFNRQKENIRVAEETYNVSLQGYRQQIVSLSDLLMSESSLTEARLSYINALLQLKTAGLEFKKAKGELLKF